MLIKYENMIDAHGIYEYIKKYASLKDSVFCKLHKCANPNECNHKQNHCMLNFDKVKNTYCSQKRIDPCKSADGLSYNDNGILFVIEIKGWELYNKYSRSKTEQEVKDKVEEYGLSAKLSHSLMICKEVLGEMGKITVPMVYLVVSDIRNEGIESIANNLSLLAETSSNFSHIYGDEIKSQLSSISNISDIDVGFVENCQEIDNELGSWTKARQIQLI